MVTKDLLQYANGRANTIVGRIREAHPGYKHYVLVCKGGTCRSGGSVPEEIAKEFGRVAEELGVMEETAITMSPCLGVCEQVPNIYIADASGGTIYNNLSLPDVKALVERHIIKGEIVEEFLPKLEG